MNEIIPVTVRPYESDLTSKLHDLIPFDSSLSNLRLAGAIQKSTLLLAAQAKIARAWVITAREEKGMRIHQKVSTGRIFKDTAEASLTITRWS